MHIMIFSNKMTAPRRINLSAGKLCGIAVGFIVLSLIVSFAFSWVSIQFNFPVVADLVEVMAKENSRKNDDYLRDNLSLMATKLGEMQAQIVKMDTLSERVSKLTGVPVAKNKDGRGGPLIKSNAPLSKDELEREIERFAKILEERDEAFAELESRLMEQRIQTTLLPTLIPVKYRVIGSGFGRRVDPFTGGGAQHEGLDFPVETGTPVTASAGGVIKTAEYHPQYGYLVEIDHGNEFSSRYAHLSKLEVQAGQLVKRGQKIALSGNTGRSTGAHLHFEVRFKGVAQNPARFLQQGGLALNLPDLESPAMELPAEKNKPASLKTENGRSKITITPVKKEAS